MKQTEAGIIIPDTLTDKPMEGTVVAVGPGKTTDYGVFHDMKVVVGDNVLFGKFAGVQIAENDEGEFIVMDQDYIIGILP
jgi:chaperonin GroES